MNDIVSEALLGRDMFGEIVKPDIKGILKNRYLIPPFSVLSARDGDWQTRKRQWIALGIQGELGRGQVASGEDLPTGVEFSHHGKGYEYAEKYNVGLDTKTQKALGCYASGFGGSIERNTGGQVGTSIFDPVLCELMYSWFCPEGGQVIDPFAGGSVRGIVAAIMGYRYWGCDLSGKQIEANREQALKICPDEIIRWVAGDAKEQLPKAPDADYIFTCPPYGNLEVYSDDPADLSTMAWPEFVKAYKDIIGLACAKLKPNRYACIVVGDFRDKQGDYRCFPSHTIRAFLDAGLKLYNEIILVTSVGSLPIRITKQFEAGQKVGKTHQNVLVFRK